MFWGCNPLYPPSQLMLSMKLTLIFTLVCSLSCYRSCCSVEFCLLLAIFRQITNGYPMPVLNFLPRRNLSAPYYNFLLYWLSFGSSTYSYPRDKPSNLLLCIRPSIVYQFSSLPYLQGLIKMRSMPCLLSVKFFQWHASLTIRGYLISIPPFYYIYLYHSLLQCYIACIFITTICYT